MAAPRSPEPRNIVKIRETIVYNQRIRLAIVLRKVNSDTKYSSTPTSLVFIIICNQNTQKKIS